MGGYGPRSGFTPILLASMVLLASLGCASDSWFREGATRADLAADRAGCIDASGNHSGVMNLETSLFVDRCLKEWGWSQVEGPSTLPEAPAGGQASAPLDPRTSFDACFARCRELTDRSKEECFDACRSDTPTTDTPDTP